MSKHVLHRNIEPFPVTTVTLQPLFASHGILVLAKLDLLQLSGSTKERMAHSLIESLIKAGHWDPVK